jgi:hypothetical protein
MEPFFTVADLFSRTALRTRANSALPNAPVQPYIERRRRTSQAVAFIRRSVRRPFVEIRRPSYSAGCTSP